MFVPDDVRKCVAYIGLRLADDQFRLAGSVFFLGRDVTGQSSASRVYAVTARHVIDKIRATGVQDAWLRLNLKDGNAGWYKTALQEWFVHPSNLSFDVALRETGIPQQFDHLVYPYSACMTPARMKEHEVSLGDEVFITGLFRHHYGSRRNIPIVRVGNLACISEEKIPVSDFGEIDGYLIEARSIGGLSGSPVFLNLGVVRIINKQIKFAQGEPIFFLLGLVHGHYDVKSAELDSLTVFESAGPPVDRVNTGIAIVVPFQSIDAVVSSFEAKHPHTV